MSAKRDSTANLAAIRKAIEATRGGWKNASDQDIADLWATFTPEQQAEILKATQPANAKTA